MQSRHPRSLISIVLAALVVAVAIGCGGSDRQEFVFTPVPFVPVGPSSERSMPWATEGENGRRYRADQVIVRVTRGSTELFLEWTRSYGFEEEVVVDAPSRDGVLILLNVPTGSAPAARDFISGAPGVEEAELRYLQHD